MLFFQSAAVMAVSIGLRLLGFRLLKTNVQSDASTVGDTAIGEHQFSIRDIFVWTLAASPVLVVLRGLDMYAVNYLRWQNVFDYGTIALALAVVSLAAIWSALGEGWIGVRMVVLVAVSVAVGLLLRWMMQATSAASVSSSGRLFATVQSARPVVDRLDHAVRRFLAATLLIFRASGYRLLRPLVGKPQEFH